VAGLKARRPDLDDVGQLVPQGWDALVQMVEQFIAVGFSKFVVLPIVEPKTSPEWIDHLAEAAGHLMPMQT
ncbi:MAG: TIGR03854 family LLM class F420-dependent oxidoreductase, partial [Ilumatobacteraceae bacterium]